MAWGQHPVDPLDDPGTYFGFMLKLVYFCFYSNGCCMEQVDLFSV